MKPAVAPHTSATGAYGSTTYTLAFLDAAGKPISPWHDIPLLASGAGHRRLTPVPGAPYVVGETVGSATVAPLASHASGPGAGSPLYSFIVEIPAGTTAKMEVQKERWYNPIMQDTSKGAPRYYTYGVPFFNYGLLPQTWEDPSLKNGPGGEGGDNDPLDVAVRMRALVGRAINIEKDEGEIVQYRNWRGSAGDGQRCARAGTGQHGADRRG